MSISEKNWFFFAFLIYSVVAWFSVGHYHDDEYYQILDFDAYKLGFETMCSRIFAPFLSFEQFSNNLDKY